MITRAFAFFTTCTLAACGGQPFDFDEAAAPFGPISSDEAAVLSASFDKMASDILAIAPTAPGGMDDSGRATFTGRAELVATAEAGGASMTLIGDASVIANFETLAVTANMNNFAGVDMDGLGQRLDGALIMDNGTIGGTSANGLAGNFRGTLVAFDYEIVADGIIEGTFRDTPVTAVSFTGLDDTALVDGERASLRLSGVAEE